jgi:hypothetical protein
MQGYPGNLLISFIIYELGMLLIQNLVSQSETLLTQRTIFLQLYLCANMRTSAPIPELAMDPTCSPPNIRSSTQI